MSRTWLVSCALIAALSAAAWGRAEFRLGGDGNSWEALAALEAPTISIFDADGGMTSRPVPVVEPPVSVLPQLTAADSMLDYTDNAIQVVWIDSSENLAITALNRGGNLLSSAYHSYYQESGFLQSMIDGDPTTAMIRVVPTSPEILGYNVSWIQNSVVNLGAELPVNRIRFYPRPGFETNYLRWYEVGVADGSAPLLDFTVTRREWGGEKWLFAGLFRKVPNKGNYVVMGGFPLYGRSPVNLSNDPNFEVLFRDEDNLDWDVDLRFPTRDLKFVAFRPLDPKRDWEVAEFEVYGEGFVTNTMYRTPILDFGQPRAWSEIRWAGDLPEGTEVSIRTRAGNTPDPLVYFSLGPGGNYLEVTPSEYQQKYEGVTLTQLGDEGELKGEIGFGVVKTELKPEWSLWSEPYVFEAGLRDTTEAAAAWEDGTPVRLPRLEGPSRYLQLEIRLVANRTVAPRLDSLSILYSEQPMAQSVVGEIWPIETKDFEPQEFTYVIRPDIRPGDRGFDRLEIVTGTRAQVHSVTVDGAEMVDRFEELDLPQILDDRIIVGLGKAKEPQKKLDADDRLVKIEVVFEGRVLSFGQEFTGWVFDSEESILRQGVTPGDATPDFSGDILSVATPRGGDLLRALEATPKSFSPNGDDINDTVMLTWDLRDIRTPRQLVLRIYTLTGRLVWQDVKAAALSGHFEESWNGQDMSGNLVPPGIYLFQAEVETDLGTEAAFAELSVAY